MILEIRTSDDDGGGSDLFVVLFAFLLRQSVLSRLLLAAIECLTATMKLKTGFVCAVRDSCDVTLAD